MFRIDIFQMLRLLFWLDYDFPFKRLIEFHDEVNQRTFAISRTANNGDDSSLDFEIEAIE